MILHEFRLCLGAYHFQWLQIDSHCELQLCICFEQSRIYFPSTSQYLWLFVIFSFCNFNSLPGSTLHQLPGKVGLQFQSMWFQYRSCADSHLCCPEFVMTREGRTTNNSNILNSQRSLGSVFGFFLSGLAMRSCSTRSSMLQQERHTVIPKLRNWFFSHVSSSK